MKRNVFFLLVFGLCLSTVAQTKFTISGYVREEGSEESLIGANVVEPSLKQGSATNSFGFYSITLPKDSVTLAISYIGYETEYYTLYLDQNVQLNFFLKSADNLLGEVTVIEEDYIQEEVQMSTIDVPIKQIDKLPALMGERDVMKVVQLLPGVQSGNEGTSGIYVRGGGPDQNLILLDGVPVYNASHLFGFFSVFNSDATKNVRLTKGGFPARFGGRLSSVVEIDMKDGDREKWGGSGTVGLIASRLMLEGPVIKGKSSLMIAARRTYIDILVQPIIFAIEPGSKGGYYFQDLNLKYNHDISDKSRIYASLYTGTDRFYFGYNYFPGPGYVDKEEGGMDWGNVTSAIRWNYQVGPRLFANVTGTYSRYLYEIGFEEQYKEPGSPKEIYAFRYFSEIEDFGLKADFDFRPNQQHLLRFGASSTFHEFSPGAIQLQESVSNLDSTLNLSEIINSGDYFAYIEDEFKVNERLTVNPGLHFSLYRVMGKNYGAVQPRFGSRFMLTEELSLKASYAYMQQYLHLLTNSNIGLPTDLWVSATDEVPPMTSSQVAVGVARTVLDNKFEFSIEGYYKTMSGLISLDNGAGFIGGGDWQDKVVTGGIGTSYGVEFFLQKKKGNTTGWIGYTLSKTDRQFPDSQINNGDPYPYKFDRRHDISLVVTHKFTERFDMGLTWVYGTGNALTLSRGQYSAQAVVGSNMGYTSGTVIDYGTKNDFRMEAYHRLDLGFNFTKPKKNGKATWSWSVYNAYARSNPFFYNWTTRYNWNTGTSKTFLAKYALFPLIPSVSWTRDF